MDKNVTYTINLNGINEAEAALDRLILKAERLRGLLEAPAKDDDGLPPIQYTVSLGNIKDIANAPSEAFSESFLLEMQKVLLQIVNTSQVAVKGEA